MTKSQAPNYKQITISNDQKSKHIDKWYFGLLEFQYCKLFVICNLAIGIFTWIGTAGAETIHLKSGLAIEGIIVGRTEDSIKVDTGVGVPVTYYLDEIEEIIAAPAPKPKTTQPPDVPSATEPMPVATAPAPVSAPPLAGPTPTSTSTPSTMIQKIEKKFPLYTNDIASLPPWQAPRPGQDEYLKTQNERARALEKKLIRQAIQYLTRLWQGLKDAHPFIKKIAEGPSCVPIAAGLWAGVYALFCFPLARIARRLQASSWMAWVPILQIFLIIRIADKSPVWFLFFFFPGANLFAFLFAWMSIARRLEKSHRLGYLMLIPGVNLLVLWYLALLPTPAPPKPQDSINTGIRFE